MSNDFDPYRKWLGIPAEEQPPNHYRLLGIGLFESDPDVIENAADRQMAHVQTRKSGEHSQLTQKLLNELSSAKLCLLDPQKKVVYDGRLRQDAAASESPPPPTPVAPQTLPQAVPLSPTPVANQPLAVGGPQPTKPIIVAGKTSPSVAYRRRSSGQKWILCAAVVAAASVAILIVAVIANQPSTGEEAAATAQGEKKSSRPPRESGAEKTRIADTSRPSDSSETDHASNPDDAPPVRVDPMPGVPTDSNPDDETTSVDAMPPKDELDKSQITWMRRPLSERLDLKELQLIIDTDAGHFSVSDLEASGARLPVPDEKQQQDAVNLVREIYQTDYENAQAPNEKLALAKEFRARASEQAEPAERFALLSEARDLVMAAANVTAALEMVDVISHEFEIDALEVKAELISDANGQTSGGIRQQSLAANALALVEDAVVSNNIDAARRLHNIGVQAAAKSRDAKLTAIGTALEEELRRLEQRIRQFEESLARQQEVPTDPTASLDVGTFYCFILGDWEQGLPQLSKSNDETLRLIAASDLANPSLAEEQSQVGDQWWEFLEQADPLDQPSVQSRVVHWYEMALDGLSGLAREKVTSRLAGLRQQAVAVAGTELPKFAADFVGKYFLTAREKKAAFPVTSVIEFGEDFQVTENGESIGRWEVFDASRIKLIFTDSDDSPMFVRPRVTKGPINATRTSRGESWRWELSRLYVAAVWEHKTNSLNVFGREFPETTETVEFYSNGRINDPLGTIFWTKQGPNLAIDWGEGKKTLAVIAPDGKTYTGKTSRPTGFGKTTLTFAVVGTLQKSE